MLEVPVRFKPVSGPVKGAKGIILQEDDRTVTETLHAHSGETGGGAANGVIPAECLTQIDRLVSSPLLQGSEALCKLLHYLAHHSLTLAGGPSEGIPDCDRGAGTSGRLRSAIRLLRSRSDGTPAH